MTDDKLMQRRCRAGHPLHRFNSVLVRHSKTGKTWLRCLTCHAARQRKWRETGAGNVITEAWHGEIGREATATTAATKRRRRAWHGEIGRASHLICHAEGSGNGARQIRASRE